MQLDLVNWRRRVCFCKIHIRYWLLDHHDNINLVVPHFDEENETMGLLLQTTHKFGLLDKLIIYNDGIAFAVATT